MVQVPGLKMIVRVSVGGITENIEHLKTNLSCNKWSCGIFLYFRLEYIPKLGEGIAGHILPLKTFLHKLSFSTKV